MAQTTGILNATAVKFSGGTSGASVAAFDHVKDSTVTINTAERDITTKDSDGWAEMLPGLKDASIDLTCLFKHDATYGYNNLNAAQLAGQKLDVEVTVGQGAYDSDPGADNDYLLSCSAYITSLTLPSAFEDNIEFSVSLKVTGAVTYAEITA